MKPFEFLYFSYQGVTAATHYDGGRNMVAMITGAKRYILSPPYECSKVNKKNVIFFPASDLIVYIHYTNP